MFNIRKPGMHLFQVWDSGTKENWVEPIAAYGVFDAFERAKQYILEQARHWKDAKDGRVWVCVSLFDMKSVEDVDTTDCDNLVRMDFVDLNKVEA